MIIFEIMFNMLIGSNTTIKFTSIIIMNFFIAIILAMYFLKKDTDENRYLKQRVNNYHLYAITQMLVLVTANLILAIFSGIFTFMFSNSPGANATMLLTLITTQWVATAIVFTCRSQWTNHKYIATICLVIVVFFALADSNNAVLVYINWILPPVSNMVVTFQEKSKMLALFPLVIRQLAYAIILFGISEFFNKKSYIK